MALNLANTVVDFLRQHPDQRFTARQIALWITETFPAQCAEKREKSGRFDSDAALVQQIVAEIGSQRPTLQRKFGQVKTGESRPRQYYWTEKSEEAELGGIDAKLPSMKSESGAHSVSLTEADLYPILSNYLWSELRIYSKRVDDRRGSNSRGSGGNKWLYPDVVGMEDLTAEWHSEIKQIVSEYADKKTKLYSFEVKLLLNRSNVRECYFQTVSNSSWANLGYLVAAQVEGTETMKELRMLFGLHGLGLIQLDPDNPAESQILIPARERPEVDWATCNRLAKENPDFLKYVELVRQFHQTSDPRPADWDLPTEV